MFKLVKFHATNLSGFYSGMGKKTVDIDLSDYIDKDVCVIVGDNGVGKSTFLSLIHPWHQPTDGRSKFVISGKEGCVIREFLGDDGTSIITKCVYMPKKMVVITGNTTCSCVDPMMMNMSN